MDSCTVTVRLIKSFEYKNFRNLIFQNVNVKDLTLKDLQVMTCERIKSNAVLSKMFPEDSSMPLDTFKLYYTRHAAKTNNPIINVGEDDRLLLLDLEGKLSDLGIGHETEISYFNWEEYQKFCNDPKFKWE